jgi:hypothetical protein
MAGSINLRGGSFLDDPMTDNAEKKHGGRWQKGQSGNPRGCARGSRHKATLAAEALLDGEAQALTRKCIEMAKAGDTIALRLCLERIVPPRKDRPVSFAMPEIASADDASQAMGSILRAIAAGDVTPSEASDIARLVEAYVKTLEIREIERRLAALEGEI